MIKSKSLYNEGMKVLNYSERAQELAKAGSEAMNKMDGLNRAFEGKEGDVKERMGDLKTLVAATTNAGVLKR